MDAGQGSSALHIVLAVYHSCNPKLHCVWRDVSKAVYCPSECVVANEIVLFCASLLIGPTHMPGLMYCAPHAKV